MIILRKTKKNLKNEKSHLRVTRSTRVQNMNCEQIKIHPHVTIYTEWRHSLFKQKLGSNSNSLEIQILGLHFKCVGSFFELLLSVNALVVSVQFFEVTQHCMHVEGDEPNV
jgi:hypothetical protein